MDLPQFNHPSSSASSSAAAAAAAWYRYMTNSGQNPSVFGPNAAEQGASSVDWPPIPAHNRPQNDSFASSRGHYAPLAANGVAVGYANQLGNQYSSLNQSLSANSNSDRSAVFDMSSPMQSLYCQSLAAAVAAAHSPPQGKFTSALPTCLFFNRIEPILFGVPTRRITFTDVLAESTDLLLLERGLAVCAWAERKQVKQLLTNV